MFQITPAQLEDVKQSLLFAKLMGFLRRTLDDFGGLDADEQAAFVLECMQDAERLRLDSESAVTSYALGAWWLDLKFEKQSALLQRLLETTLPLPRKVHAMNEWVHSRLRSPRDVARADEALRVAFGQTHAWGVR